MKIYQIQNCPYAHRARIVLNEKAIPHEVVLYAPKSRPPELDAVSADAKSPTLFDGNARVWESMVAIEYLEDSHPQPALLPSSPEARAHTRITMREIDSKLMPLMGAVSWETVHKPVAERDDTLIQAAFDKFVDGLLPWNARLADRTFLQGDAFTLADVLLFTPLFALHRDAARSAHLLDPHPHVRAWYGRMAARRSTAY